MAIDWGKVRQAMTTNDAYRGTGGRSRPRQLYGGDQGKGGQGNVWRPSAFSQRQPGIAAANVRPRSGGIWDAVKARGRKITPWMADIAGKVGDTFDDAMRGSRLHKAFKDKYGGSGEWKAAKASMMTDKDQAFYDKYMNLAEMAQDNEKAQEYRDIAETAWRNKQTSDRLAAYTGFEDYLPGKYTGEGEGARYTGNVPGGRDRIGQFVPGVGIMQDIADRLRGPGDTETEPDMDITADLYGGYPGPEDDVLWGEPGTESFRPEIKEKPRRTGISYPEPDMFDTLYGEPTPDPFGGMYESPLTDRLYGEPTNIGLASEKALGKRGFAIPGGEGYTGPLPNISIELGPYDEDLSNIDRYSDKAKRLGLSDTLQTYNTYTHGMGTRQKPATAEGLENIKKLGIAADDYDREEELQNLIADHYNSATGLFEESPVSKGRWGSTYNQYR